MKKWFTITYIIIVIFTLLFPMIKIDRGDKSESENRPLAKSPHLYIAGHFNEKFGSEFDKWLSDRFFLREKLIKIHANFKAQNTFVSNKKAFAGLNGWLFSKAEINDAPCYTERELEIFKKNIRYLKEFCATNNIKCYIEIVPRREDYAGPQSFRMPGPDKALDLKRELDPIVPVIFPQKELHEADKKDFVYFKTDHHWTEWGAYIGYLALMDRIKKDIPTLKPVSEDLFEIFYTSTVRAGAGRTFGEGSTCKLLNLDEKKCLDKSVTYKNYKLKDEASLQKIDVVKFISQHPLNQEKTVLIGNSFLENFSTFWGPTFSETRIFRGNNTRVDNLKLARWEQEIIDYKPDILVIIINSWYTFQLKTIDQQQRQ